MRVTNRANILVDQGQFSDPDFTSGTHQRENVKFADNICDYRFSYVFKNYKMNILSMFSYNNTVHLFNF